MSAVAPAPVPMEQLVELARIRAVMETAARAIGCELSGADDAHKLANLFQVVVLQRDLALVEVQRRKMALIEELRRQVAVGGAQRRPRC